MGDVRGKWGGKEVSYGFCGEAGGRRINDLWMYLFTFYLNCGSTVWEWGVEGAVAPALVKNRSNFTFIVQI